jgi:heme A synthase
MEGNENNKEIVIEKPTNYFVKFAQWLKTFVEDDNGKISIKRVIAFMLSITVCYVILHIVRNNDMSKFNWDSTNLLLTVVFGQISLLITAVIIEKKHALDKSTENSDSDKPSV